MKKIVGILLLLVVTFFSKAQDLHVTAVSKTSVDQYAKFDGTFTVTNDGIAAANKYFYVEAYLSTDNIAGNDDDKLFFTNFVDKLEAGASVQLDYCCSYAIAAPGSYTLFVYTDRYEQINETDESNNLFIVPDFKILPPDIDFKPGALTFESQVTAQNTLDASINILKSGNTDFGRWMTVSLYLSTDNVRDAGDKELNSMIITYYDADEPSITKSILLPIPDVTPGNYFVLLSVDDSGMQSGFNETNESNNIMGAPLTVLPGTVDLEPKDVYATATGNQIGSISCKIWNRGSTPVGGFTVDAYLSSDQTFNPGLDVYMAGTRVLESIPAGSYEYVSLYSGYTLEPGSYYIILKVNPDGALHEISTLNNQAVSNQFGIAAPPPPLIEITSGTLAQSYDSEDTQLEMQLQFHNISDMSISPYEYYSVYIRDIWGAFVYLGSQRDTLTLDGNQSVQKTWMINLEDPLPVGDYTAYIFCASQQFCFTKNYQFQFHIDPVNYSLTGTVNGEDGTPITKGKLFLYQKGDDGLVRLRDQRVLENTNEYSFDVGDHPQTLYFIPDPVMFPDYIPTILTKAVVLSDDCFITVNSATTLDMEVIKINPPPAGPGVINGSVSSESSDSGRVRLGALSQSGSNVPVILLSESGQAVGLTYSDPEGYFEFKNIAAAKYKLVAAFELDQILMAEPFAVDITTQNKTVGLVVTDQGIQGDQEIFMQSQSIAFDELPNKTFNDEPFVPELSINSGLPVTLSSSNLLVATTANGQITIVGAGTTMITASQEGNARFNPAASVERQLTVDKASQTISFETIESKTTEDTEFIPAASASSELDLSFTSDNTAVAEVDGNKVIIIGEGTTNITAHQEGNENYLEANPVTRVLIVELVLAVENGANGLLVYPNPSPGIFFIDHKDKQIKELSLTDVSGKQRSIQLADQIDITSSVSGVYYLKVKTATGFSIFRLVKK